MLKQIRKLIEEYYNIPKGMFIKNYLDEIVFLNGKLNIRMTRRALKHIVEQRKQDDYSPQKIESLFTSFIDIIETHNYIIIKDIKTHNKYLLTEKINSGKYATHVALELIFIEPDIYYIKTAFYRSI